jgi:hypothetical protein
MSDDHPPQPEDRDEIPRQSLWAAFPKRSLWRVAVLLALLAVILYLRARAGSIAVCMSDAFRAPAPSQARPPLKGRVVLPAPADGKPTR